MRFWAAVALVAVLGTGGVWWLASAQDDPLTVDQIGDQVQTRKGGAVPAFADKGDTAALYRFAKAERDVLQWMPCACGCARFGHTSNRSCYIKSESGDQTTWTSHAAT
jgi:hypothetical protein